MSYESWRITYQSSEQAARAAYASVVRLTSQMETLQASRNFYARRCEALQAVQGKMRDPERKAVCDILANGETYVALGPVDRSHRYVQSKEHGGCSQCGYPEWEPWHAGANA